MELRPIKVLVVDDDSDTASVTSDLLILSGYQTRPAFNGKHALIEAKTWQPTVVFIDISMPDMDGFVLAEKLRELYEHRPLFLVAYTGFNCQSIMREALARGFDAVLQKPARLGAFDELISSGISESARTSQKQEQTNGASLCEGGTGFHPAVRHTIH